MAVTNGQNTGRMNAADWFKDVPWFNLPPTMSGQLIMEPMRPALRLLGGSSSSGKPSKLAALAAARKKKEAEQNLGQTSAAPKENVLPSSAVSLLDLLGSRNDVGGQGSRIPVSAVHSSAGSQQAPRAYPVRRKKSPSPPPAKPKHPPRQSKKLRSRLSSQKCNSGQLHPSLPRPCVVHLTLVLIPLRLPPSPKTY